MFERSLQLLLHISKRFNAFQVLKWFLLLLEVTKVARNSFHFPQTSFTNSFVNTVWFIVSV